MVTSTKLTIHTTGFDTVDRINSAIALIQPGIVDSDRIQTIHPKQLVDTYMVLNIEIARLRAFQAHWLVNVHKTTRTHATKLLNLKRGQLKDLLQLYKVMRAQDLALSQAMGSEE